MTLNGVMAVILRYFTEFGKPALHKTIMAEFMQEFIVFLARVQCRRKQSSRSLSHLLMSFLFCVLIVYILLIIYCVSLSSSVQSVLWNDSYPKYRAGR